MKDFDEERTYSFADRIYEEHHEPESLQRELFRAEELHEHNLLTKYDEASDQLYLMFVYKNNPRRVSSKEWQSSWKVVPAYEAWLQHFKSNDNNLNNYHYYDIDPEKIGNIRENCNCFSLVNGDNGAVLIRKDYTVANRPASLLYGLKNGLLFGANPSYFYATHGHIRVYHS